MSPGVYMPFGLESPARYNIAPSQPVAAVRIRPHEGNRELVGLRWGLIPSWADDPKIGYKLINARAETAATKPSFRAAFESRRCLIPATGFYEWQKLDPLLFRLTSKIGSDVSGPALP